MAQEVLTSTDLIAPYKSRYTDIARNEKVGSVRNLISFTRRFFSSEFTSAALSMYTYMRILDDAVDESPNVLPVMHLLNEERRSLLGYTPPTALQDEFISEPLHQLFEVESNRVKLHLNKMLAGFTIDLNIRYTQQPPPKNLLRIRNFLDIYPVLSIFCMAARGIDPKPTKAIVDTMDDLGTYDNISDFFEDLPNGLVLISQENLVRFNINLQDGRPLPIEELMNYNRAKRIEVGGNLRNSAAAIFGLEIPLRYKALIYAYLFTRSLKTLIPLPIQEGLVYSVPVDAVTRNRLLNS